MNCASVNNEIGLRLYRLMSHDYYSCLFSFFRLKGIQGIIVACLFVLDSYDGFWFL
jgi:hypothetical protein